MAKTTILAATLDSALKEFFEASGLAQASWAKLLGVHRQSVGHWIRGTHTPRPQYLERLQELAPFIEVPADVRARLADALGVKSLSVPIYSTRSANGAGHAPAS